MFRKYSLLFSACKEDPEGRGGDTTRDSQNIKKQLHLYFPWFVMLSESCLLFQNINLSRNLWTLHAPYWRLPPSRYIDSIDAQTRKDAVDVFWQMHTPS